MKPPICALFLISQGAWAACLTPGEVETKLRTLDGYRTRLLAAERAINAAVDVIDPCRRQPPSGGPTHEVTSTVQTASGPIQAVHTQNGLGCQNPPAPAAPPSVGGFPANSPNAPRLHTHQVVQYVQTVTGRIPTMVLQEDPVPPGQDVLERQVEEVLDNPLFNEMNWVSQPSVYGYVEVMLLRAQSIEMISSFVGTRKQEVEGAQCKQ